MTAPRFVLFPQIHDNEDGNTASSFDVCLRHHAVIVVIQIHDNDDDTTITVVMYTAPCLLCRTIDDATVAVFVGTLDAISVIVGIIDAAAVFVCTIDAVAVFG